MSVPEVIVCGVRHHGPGSARSVATVLDAVQPATVIIEGPPELDGLTAWAGSPELVPPVAALTYRPDRPAASLFYPMASFSPEWVALRWAMANQATVAFADLPAANALADKGRKVEGPDADADDEREVAVGRGRPARLDPIGELAAAAGYNDAERWWEDAIEHRHTAADGFRAIAEAVAEIRRGHLDDVHNQRREAAMRRVLRRAIKASDGPIVVVCGAFHAPALQPDAFPTATADTRLLKGLPRTRVAATWVPWTARRLATASGYGAGVTSPGWYDHCYQTPEEDRTTRWMVKVARALRDADLPAPSASAIEAARLAATLASLRGRPHAGLAECTDAAQAVLCAGATGPLQVIHDEVVVGHGLGQVPEEIPQVPLAKDLEAQARGARLQRAAEPKTFTADLRTPAGLAKSTLLHRLAILDIGWGRQVDAGGTTGTFKEAWTIQWQPELSVQVIVASTWGATVEQAAAACATDRATAAADLAEVVGILRACLPADLPQAASAVALELDRRAAGTHDALTLMAAAEPLASTCRYGDVRQQDTSRLRHVLDALVRRVAAGLAPAVTGLDDDAAVAARRGIDGVIRAVRLLASADLSAIWLDAVQRLIDLPTVHPGIVGRVVRLLHDHQRLAEGEAADRLARELSPARPARDAAAWVDGFLDADATLLLLDDRLLATIDGWVASTPGEAFNDLLPLLRRTFSRYSATERQQIGTLIRHGRRERPDQSLVLDAERGLPAVRHVLELLGGLGGR